MPRRHILVTGAPGAGKTTAVMEVARRLANLQPAGFTTAEVRAGGVRRGFDLVSLPSGRRAPLARKGLPSPFRVGDYGVDLPGFEAFLLTLAWEAPATRLVVIDEIGKMECFSVFFRRQVRRLLEGPVPVLATVALRGGGFIAEVKGRGDVRRVVLDARSREALPARLAAALAPKGMMEGTGVVKS